MPSVYRLLQDSGRAADLVAELHACYCDGDNNGAAGGARPKTGVQMKTTARDAEINAM
jgi:hypothetical protein